jgi:hypothetical protein
VTKETESCADDGSCNTLVAADRRSKRETYSGSTAEFSTACRGSDCNCAMHKSAKDISVYGNHAKIRPFLFRFKFAKFEDSLVLLPGAHEFSPAAGGSHPTSDSNLIQLSKCFIPFLNVHCSPKDFPQQ